MKRLLLFVVMLFLIIQSATSQSKVAVLDASLGEDVHPNASSIVADTLNEQFVKSGDYIAIDRAYISSIQAEKQFQLSGDVKDQDIKELGNTFGAEYLCIANVSLLGQTYTVSARLIEVESAQVVSQESGRKKGEIDVLFAVAEEVGNKFVGKNIPGQKQPKTEVVKKEEKPEPEPKPQPSSKKPVRDSQMPKSHFTVGYMIPGYMGEDGNDSYSGDSYYSFYEQDLWMLDNWTVDDAWNSSWGLDFHLLVPVNYLYWSLGASFTNHSTTAESGGSEYKYQIFTTFDMTAGFGGAYMLVPNLQVFGGVDIGFLVFTLGSNYSKDASEPYWTSEYQGESATGFMFGLELGADYFLGDFCINLKYKLSYSPDLTGDMIFTDDYQDLSGGDTSFGVHGLVIGAGFGW